MNPPTKIVKNYTGSRFLFVTSFFPDRDLIPETMLIPDFRKLRLLSKVVCSNIISLCLVLAADFVALFVCSARDK